MGAGAPRSFRCTYTTPRRKRRSSTNPRALRETPRVTGRNPKALGTTSGAAGKPKHGHWWESEPATMALAKELGLEARVGESMQEFRARIVAEVERRKHEHKRGSEPGMADCLPQGG